ncbi:hypothetical protein WH47_05354, partial [Habropoda laboriosa]
YVYKIRLTQELKPTDHLVLGNQAVDAAFCKKIVLSDEIHFHLNEYGNKQNCRIWVAKYSHVIEKKLMHLNRVILWCGLWAGDVIGWYFFESVNAIVA